MKRLSLWIAVSAIALLSGAVGARAFTVETYSSDGSQAQHLADPDETAPIQNLTGSNGNSSGTNFLGSHFNFSVSGNGAQSSGASSSFGRQNYFDPSQSPVSPNVGFSTGPFGMFGPRP